MALCISCMAPGNPYFRPANSRRRAESGCFPAQLAAAVSKGVRNCLRGLLGGPICAATTRRLQLKPGKTAMPPVSAYWNPGMGLVLAADKMPDMPPGRTLQLWVVPQQGAPISVGIFRPNAAGQVLMVMPPANAMLMAKALAISDEPAGGSPQPTSTPEWVGPVS